jgi:putative transferase (TIGR04331 family)
MIQKALKKYSTSHVRCIKREENLIAQDMDHFQELMISDRWNEEIFANILKNEKKITIEVIEPKKTVTSFKENKIINKLNAFFLKSAKHTSNIISSLICRENEQFLMGTYLSFQNEILLNLRINQVPRKWALEEQTLKIKCHLKRKNYLELKSLNCEFGVILQKNISDYFPFVFLENFQEALEVALKTPWPATPGSIFTSNSHYSNALFSIWAAAKTENKVPFFIGQHGGSFGVAKWNFLEDHDCNVADKYFSFGWSKSKSKKIIPIGNFIESGRMIKRQNPSTALMVTMSMPRYSYWLYSGPVAAEQWQSYFLDLISFAKACSEDIKKSLLVRLYFQDYGNNQKERWVASFTEIRLD